MNDLLQGEFMQLMAESPCTDTLNLLHALCMIAGDEYRDHIFLHNYRQGYRYLFENLCYWN